MVPGDNMTVKLNLPAQITSGDSIDITDTVSEYTAADGWTLTYSLSDGENQYQFSSTANGQSHDVDVTAAATTEWAPGKYRWQATVAKAAQRFTVGRGFVTIRPDFGNSATDPRHHVEIVLDAIESTLEGRATQDQQALSISGRSVTRMPIEDLLKFRDRYKSELNQIKAAERIAQGLGSGKKIMVRF